MSARELITEHLDLWAGAVTKKSSSGRGRNGKVELTGVKKLRELILQLAVMGRLVEQDAADTSPKLQLDTISRERTGLAAAEKIRLPSRRSTLSTQEKKPFSIPASWYWTKLEDLFAVVTDGDHQAPPKSENGVPFLVIGNLNSGQVNFLGCKHVDEAYYEKLDWGRKPTSGDLLYTVTGSYGIPIKVETERAFCVQRHVAILRATDSTPGDFVKLLLASTFGKAYADRIATGIAQKTVPLTGLRKMPVPLPPIQEQHRIVQKVDELMALCDRLEQQTSDQLEAHETLVDALLGTLTQAENATELADNWARLAAHFDTLFTTEQSIDKLKQTILQLAVIGRLVEQEAREEPASDLIQRINAERLRLEGKRKVRGANSAWRGSAVKPSTCGWATCTLGTCISLISGQHLKGDEYFDEKRLDSIPYLTGPAEFGPRTPEPQRHTLERRAVAIKGDILITCKGSGVGKLNTASEEIAISRQLMAARPILINAHFLYLLLDSLRDTIREKTVGIAIPGISRGDILDAKIQLPPLGEQQRIVQKVDELMALCDQLKERLNQACETRCQLAGTVVEKALG